MPLRNNPNQTSASCLRSAVSLPSCPRTEKGCLLFLHPGALAHRCLLLPHFRTGWDEPLSRPAACLASLKHSTWAVTEKAEWRGLIYYQVPMHQMSFFRQSLRSLEAWQADTHMRASWSVRRLRAGVTRGHEAYPAVLHAFLSTGAEAGCSL